MKWVGQSITDFIARFRSDVYLESISSGTIASGGNLGLDSNNKIVKATAFDGDITGVTAGTNLTGGGTSGTVTLNLADASDSVKGAASFSSNNFSVHSGAVSLATAQTWTDPVITSDNFHFTSANANDPLVLIKNTADDATSGRLRFLNQRGADGQDNDETGIIEFFGYDDGTPGGERYARIIGTIHDATSTEESGKLSLQVASHDGGDEDGLVLTGGSVDAEVDVTIGNGAASVVTIPGHIDLAGDIDVDGTLETDALTIGGATISATGSTAITTLGTITTGTWQGTAIAAGYTKHRSYYEFMGFNNGNTTEDIYQHASALTDTKAPFEHEVDHNVDVEAVMVVGTYFKAGGQVVTRDGTVTLINGWAHTNGTSAVHKIALVKLTPAEDDNTDVSPVLIDEVSWTSLGADKLKAINETTITAASVAAGDILMTMIKDDTGGRTVYFNLTVEIEF